MPSLACAFLKLFLWNWLFQKTPQKYWSNAKEEKVRWRESERVREEPFVLVRLARKFESPPSSLLSPMRFASCRDAFYIFKRYVRWMPVDVCCLLYFLMCLFRRRKQHTILTRPHLLFFLNLCLVYDDDDRNWNVWNVIFQLITTIGFKKKKQQQWWPGETINYSYTVVIRWWKFGEPLLLFLLWW